MTFSRREAVAFSPFSDCFLLIIVIKVFRCLYRRCPPLPIPNRAVKPARADGIAVTGVRVGRRRILFKAPLHQQWGFFCNFIARLRARCDRYASAVSSYLNLRTHLSPSLLPFLKRGLKPKGLADPEDGPSSGLLLDGALPGFSATLGFSSGASCVGGFGSSVGSWAPVGAFRVVGGVIPGLNLGLNPSGLAGTDS